VLKIPLLITFVVNHLVYTVVLDISARIPLYLSLNTWNTLVASRSATVTAVPFGSVSGLVTPLSVSVTGSVVVASDGIALAMRTVKYPIG
jgi:hypothetical protein